MPKRWMLVAPLLLSCAHLPASGPPVAFRVSATAPAAHAPLDGRLLLFFAKDGSSEPRDQLSDLDSTAQLFGQDVLALAPGQPITLDSSAFGYPLQRLPDLPPGDYFVQAVFHVYETFHRADGHLVQLPADRGEGQQWRTAPGNLFSAPKKVTIGAGLSLQLVLDQVNPPLEEPKDTTYIKHVHFQSELLSKFWGRPVNLGAVVLLPEGFDTHPNARYPLVVAHGHFERTRGGFRETPPDPALPPTDLAALARDCPNGHEKAACTRAGYERLQQQKAYEFYRQWTGPGFPRVIEVAIQHANPYYDDSYAVNSANLGPYGDAITYELIPYLEKRYRGLGPWARGTYGGSTGGWEALAVQVLYPDQYNGAIGNCPDPIDFHHFQVVDLYANENAYRSTGPFRSTARPGERDYLGQVRGTVEQANHKELALGTHSRSGDQWDAWEAVYSPVGPDGYPRRVWDKESGQIDRTVVDYWREHFDLGYLLERDWATLGPKLRGKLNINVGRADNFFLNDAVYRVEELLARLENPASEAKFDYGARDEHCWSGDHDHVNAISRLTYAQRLIPQLVKHWLATAPPGADTTSWRY